MENVNKPSTSIKNWAIDDRPREKLISKGPETLSNSELLAILLINGYKHKTAIDLAKEVLKLGQDNLNELGKLTFKDFMKVKGIGEAKSIMIVSALELGRRRQTSAGLRKPVIRCSADIAQYLQALLKDYNYEVLGVCFLNQANKINHFEIVSRGGVTGTVVDPRVILKKAIEQNTTSIILCHNHPSGSLKPSNTDEELTRKMKLAASYLDIKVIDHIIVSEAGYFSFADEGLL